MLSTDSRFALSFSTIRLPSGSSPFVSSWDPDVDSFEGVSSGIVSSGSFCSLRKLRLDEKPIKPVLLVAGDDELLLEVTDLGSGVFFALC